MLKPFLTAVATTLAVSSLASSAATAGGLRIGFGFGVGVGVAMGAYGASHGHWGRRSEGVVGGRYRCCGEREVVERAPRKLHREEREAKKAVRKKPAEADEAKVAAPRKHRTKPAVSAPEVLAAAAGRSAIAVTDPTLSARIVGLPAMPTTGAAAVAATTGGKLQVETDATAGKPGAERLTAELPRALRSDASRDVPETVAAESAATGAAELNCRKYFPALGRSMPVSCYE